MIRFILNEKEVRSNLSPATLLLDLVRYQQNLKGTKIGCREGDCGACTVLIGEMKKDVLSYRSMTSCLLPLANINGKHVVTIEGINPVDDKMLTPIQQAMADEGATQCGFCTPGFVMSLAGFCLSDIPANKANAIAAIDGNICRCTGYKSIERAASRIAGFMQERNDEEPAQFAGRKGILPNYFTTIKQRLQQIHPSTAAADSESDGYRIPTPHPIATGSRLIAGGTDLYVQHPDEMTETPARFVFNQEKEIIQDGNKCIISAAATVTDLKNSPIIQQAFPAFNEYAKLISSTPIRNMATIAGNFINASPIGDLTIFFLALDAKIILHDGMNKRELPLRKLYTGYKTLDKKPEEFIESINFELPDKNDLFHFEKVSKRTHLDIASVNTAIRVHMLGNKIQRAAISAGGVGPIPMLLENASAFLRDKEASDGLINQVIEIAQKEISPISDARGSKEYKSLLLGQLIKSHFIILLHAK